MRSARHGERSEAIHACVIERPLVYHGGMDGVVASLLAMTAFDR